MYVIGRFVVSPMVVNARRRASAGPIQIGSTRSPSASRSTTAWRGGDSPPGASARTSSTVTRSNCSGDAVMVDCWPSGGGSRLRIAARAACRLLSRRRGGPQCGCGFDGRVVAQAEQPRSGALSRRQILQCSPDDRGDLAVEHKLLGCRRAVGDLDVCELPTDCSCDACAANDGRCSGRSRRATARTDLDRAAIRSSRAPDRARLHDDLKQGRAPEQPSAGSPDDRVVARRQDDEAVPLPTPPAPRAPRPTSPRHGRGAERPSTHSANREPIG
jgi:hypothetical protein